MNEDQFKDLMGRVEKLEKAVFSEPRAKTISRKAEEDYSGATGGIRLLADEGFFKSKRSLGEIKNELAKRNYHYSLQAVQMGLNRLSKAFGILVAFKERGRKVYAQRK